MTARDRKRRIHALLSRWETIRFANSEKECAEDFAAMIVDLEDRLAATPAPPDARGTPYSMESVRSWMGLDVWLSLGHDFHDWPGWTADGWADMMAEIRPLAATPTPLDDSVRGEWGRQTCCPFPHDEDSGPDIHPRHQRTYQPATFAAATPAPLDVDRLERALERVWTAGGVDPAWWVSAAAIAAAYAEETK